jgi:hypothetical protein
MAVKVGVDALIAKDWTKAISDPVEGMFAGGRIAPAPDIKN